MSIRMLSLTTRQSVSSTASECLIFQLFLVNPVSCFTSGGGFVIGSPESNEVYLRDWANKLPNVPIISVGYSVSPEAKFPTALQEVLDSYLYLTSGDPAILSMLGFHPKTVAFCGDSAGATLLTAMTMALNDIRHFNHQNDQQDEKSGELLMFLFSQSAIIKK